ncbi:hypothetical protein NC653_019592 [Populus alba x Populus x berolinensis]|uniref:Uncharacterized protein n=1 Tax=Populus alba x Populus x berolinensis TaxID=444605 RepID=A0AAD6QJE0_9ROSI|nr:hypothetical protein NC653_019592 [Populus alba x Populus x berolinensis]
MDDRDLGIGQKHTALGYLEGLRVHFDDDFIMGGQCGQRVECLICHARCVPVWKGIESEIPPVHKLLGKDGSGCAG